MTNTARTILACVDGSHYSASVCAHAAWVGHRLHAPVHVLHVQPGHGAYTAPADYSGALGLGERTALREKLTQIDEARGKLEQHKGKLILDQATAQLRAAVSPQSRRCTGAAPWSTHWANWNLRRS